VSFGWYESFADPVRRNSLRTALQFSYTGSLEPIAPPVPALDPIVASSVTVGGPNFDKVIFYQTFARPPEIIIPSFGYFEPLSDPKDLSRKGLKAHLQQSIIQGAVDEIYSFRSTGPLYVNHRSGRPATFWKGRTR